MKMLCCRFALILASVLGFSAAAYADALPAGAVRFSVYNDYSTAIDVPVPKGATLVITDIAVFSGQCTVLDGDERKMLLHRGSTTNSLHVGLQTGLEFNNGLRFDLLFDYCSGVTVSGYWLNAP